MPHLALVRHGQSIWNAEERFTGWVDVPLTEYGRREAKAIAFILKDTVLFDVAYTSMLVRAQETLSILLQHLGQADIPVIRHEALNERRYGDLEGLGKPETAARYGADQVHRWRRSFRTSPPGGESLADTFTRVWPFFTRAILGDLHRHHNVLVSAHGNSLRALVMGLDALSEEAVEHLEVPTGIVLLYQCAADGVVTEKQVLDARTLVTPLSAAVPAPVSPVC